MSINYLLNKIMDKACQSRISIEKMIVDKGIKYKRKVNLAGVGMGVRHLSKSEKAYELILKVMERDERDGDIFTEYRLVISGFTGKILALDKQKLT